MSEGYATVFSLLAELAASLGVRRINELDGCWEAEIDARWWVAVNGHPEPVQCSRGVEVGPYTAYIEWCGWPAGVVTPAGGFLVAHPTGANEDNLVRALEQRISGAG